MPCGDHSDYRARCARLAAEGAAAKDPGSLRVLVMSHLSDIQRTEDFMIINYLPFPACCSTFKIWGERKERKKETAARMN